MPIKRTLLLLVVTLATACGGSGPRKVTGVTALGPFGKGAAEAYVYVPAGAKPRGVVIFLHGRGDITPKLTMPWVRHLVSTDLAVVWPRYEVDTPNEHRELVVAHVVAGVRNGIAHDNLAKLPTAVIGYSWGARLAFDYTAVAHFAKTPVPVAMVSVFPSPRADGDQHGSFSGINTNTPIMLLVADQDHDVSDVGAKQALAELAAANYPASEITGVVIHSSPGFVADHLSAMGTGPMARKQYWARADTFIDKQLPK